MSGHIISWFPVHFCCPFEHLLIAFCRFLLDAYYVYIPFWNPLGIINTILYFWKQGFRSFVWTAVSYQLKDNLKLSPSASQFITSIAFFPWSIKPLYGYLSILHTQPLVSFCNAYLWIENGVLAVCLILFSSV